MNAAAAWLDAARQTLDARPWLAAGTILAVSAVAALVLTLLVSRVFLVWARRSRTTLDDRLLKMLHRPLFVSIVLVGLWLAAQQLAVSAAGLTFFGRALATVALPLWIVFGLRSSHLLLETASGWEGHLEFIEPRTLTLFENISRLVLVSGGI